MRRSYKLALASALVLVAFTVPSSLALSQDVGTQVVGGHGVPNGKYPWVSALLYEPYRNQEFCVGSLIDRTSIVTAAHCATDPARDISVTVGKTVLSDDSEGVVREVAQKRVHPRHGRPCLDCYDVAVLNFSKPVHRSYKPIVIGPSTLEAEGSDAVVAGWGAVDSTGTVFPDRMHAAVVQIRSDRYSKGQWGGLFNAPIMIGAHGIDSGTDTCVGDSGGPLFSNTPDGQRLLGVTSYGPALCGNNRQPGVYTELNAKGIRGWIYKVSHKSP